MLHQTVQQQKQLRRRQRSKKSNEINTSIFMQNAVVSQSSMCALNTHQWRRLQKQTCRRNSTRALQPQTALYLQCMCPTPGLRLRCGSLLLWNVRTNDDVEGWQVDRVDNKATREVDTFVFVPQCFTSRTLRSRRCARSNGSLAKISCSDACTCMYVALSLVYRQQ